MVVLLIPRSSPAPSRASTTSRARSSKTSRTDRVRDGRIQKSPRKKTASLETHAELLEDKLRKDERQAEEKRYELMKEERELYPDAKHWHADESRLFELLFMRGFSPLFPSHWGIDFRGIPVPDILFQTSESDKPVVYSQSGKDYRATKALTTLIDAATTVRCMVEAGQNEKAPAYLKKSLDEYLDWAAADGGYDHLNVIPNVLVAVVDVQMPGEEISDWMIDQMDILAQKHRDYLRIEEDSDSDKENRDQPPNNMSPKPPVTDDRFREPPVTPTSDRAAVRELKVTMSSEEQVPEKEPEAETQAKNAPGAEVPIKASVKYHEPPPVLYGLFIMRTTVMVLTADAAKEGEDFLPSYQVELGFGVKDQALWNAMTIGIIVCQARADMVTRAALFSPKALSDESDPDA